MGVERALFGHFLDPTVEDFPRKCRARRNAALYNSALEYCFRR